MENLNYPCENCMHFDVCAFKNKMKEIKVECEHPYAVLNLKCEKYVTDVQTTPKML